MRHTRKMGLTAVFCAIAILLLSSPAQANERIINTGDKWLNSIAVSPDGKWILTAHGVYTESIFGRGHVAFWEVKSGKKIATIKLGQPVHAIAFSPDGKTIAAVGPHLLALLDVKSRKHLRTLSRDWAGDVAFSPDGKRLATASNPVHIWDVKTGKVERELKDDAGAWYVSFSRDGKMLASTQIYGKVIVWNADTGAQIKTLDVEGGSPIRFSPAESQLLFVSPGLSVPAAIWNIKEGKAAVAFEKIEGCYGAAYSNDGKYIFTANWSSLDVLDANTGKELGSRKSEDRIVAVSYLPNENAIVFGERLKDDRVRLVIVPVEDLLQKQKKNAK